MGIFGAMTTAVSGLRAQSYSLENISGNIANSQTTGFKRVDTSFVDLIPDLPRGKEVSGSVSGFSRLTNTIQGDLQATGISTNMALSGEGFFVVQEATGSVNNRPVFGGGDLYTRRGDFSLDKSGYLVNRAGLYLKGSTIDPGTGRVNGSLGPIQIPTEPVAARATREIVYRANLPTQPATTTATAGGSHLFSDPPASFPAGYDPRVFTATDNPPGVRADDEARFLSESVPGGSLTAYDALGNPADMQLRWAKISSTSPETWNLFYRENASATGAAVVWRNAGTPFTFGGDGQMTSPTNVTLDNLTVDGVTVGTAQLNFGTGGLTQFASPGGLVQISTVEQDGNASITLDSIAITTDGAISGTYSNGRVATVGSVSVAQFSADNALKRRDGGAYEQTLESGLPILALNGSTVIGGNVEGSNTDIAEEFSKMIVTQQAYSANTRVVSTSQQMLSDVINMVR